MQRLLMTSCSARKRTDAGLMPALEWYDGPSFRVLRRFLAQHPLDQLDTVILSARFGLVDSAERIPYYNQPLTCEGMQALQPVVKAAVEQRLQAKPYKEIFVCVSRPYARVLGIALDRTATEARIQVATGQPGRRLSELHDWLHGHGPAFGNRLGDSVASHARIRGVEVALSAEDILELARRALAEHRGDPARFQSWFVNIDGTRVGPKWLVTQMTGLASSRFGASDACRLLARLGVPVERQ